MEGKVLTWRRERLELSVKMRRHFSRKLFCTNQSPNMFDLYIFRLYRRGQLFRLESVLVSVTYDGASIMVMPHPLLRAKLCGVCGNFDGNSKNEFVSKDGQFVDQSVFLESWCK